MIDDENYDYPKTVFVHAFKLIDPRFGYIATFGTREAAITYMNLEFL